MRTILQSEAAECGLACLAMVADHHGKQLELRELRGRFAMSLKGATLGGIVSIAESLGLMARAIRLEPADLGELPTPCILHWDMNHFVVLASVGRRHATIVDPALGRRVVSLAELAEHFTGVALELAPATSFVRENGVAGVRLRTLLGDVQGLTSAALLILALSLALQVFAIGTPLYLQWVVDQVVVSADRGLLLVLGIGFTLMLVLQVATQYLRAWSLIFLSNRLGQQWIASVFAHVLRLPLEFFQKRHLGDVTSRMGAVTTIQRTLAGSFVEVIIDGLMAIATLSMMLVYSGRLALLTLAGAAVYLLLRGMAYTRLRTETERQLVADSRHQTFVLESLRGIQSIKVACGEQPRRLRNLALLNDTVNCQVRLARLQLGFNSANQLIFGIERIAVIWIGASFALDNVFSVGMLIAYLAFKDQFIQRVSGLIDKWIDLRMLRLHAERLADLVLAEPEPDAEREPASADGKPAALRVERLRYRYAEGEPWVLDDCSLEVRAGESVAIVGVSGCGKTTLVKLMLGLMRPDTGRIVVDGQDLQAFGPRAFRTHVGAVMQDDQLFAGSIAENIAFGSDGPDLERVVEAARAAAIHDDVVAMPMGYHSLIGDMGSSLSGGQKQRVLLARALYRKPRILFLDEATSHLDERGECAVNEAIKALSITRVIIAHRRETIASADRVIVLDAGRVRAESLDAAARASHGVAVAA